MIERYTRPEMGTVWTDERKVHSWLAVELAVCEAWHRRGRIPAEPMLAIRNASCDVGRMREIERETDHDVIAFLRATGETVGEASRYIHLGLTSSDVVDTGLALQVSEAGKLLSGVLLALIEATAHLASAHRKTLTIGRTHGIHAEPTTFGFKLLVIHQELARHRERLDFAREGLRVGKISGAVGTHAHLSPEIEEEVCVALGLVPALASNQVLQRDRHAFFFAVIAGIGSTLDKMATEIRHLQRTEVREAAEPFAPGNQGSSAMPHKRNPHASERICGLARLLRGYALTASENVPLWHERDISHSSSERVIFPDATIVLDFMLAEMTEIVRGLDVSSERMRENLDLTKGLIYSQRVLLALVDAGLDRQDAYAIVQTHAMEAWTNARSFAELLLSDQAVAEVMGADELAALFDPQAQLVHIDEIFARAGFPADPAMIEVTSL